MDPPVQLSERTRRRLNRCGAKIGLGDELFPWLQFERDRGAHAWLSGLIRTTRDLGGEIAFLTVSPPEVADPVARGLVWDLIRRRVGLIWQRVGATALGGIHTAQFIETAANERRVHPHIHGLGFPKEQISKDDPAWTVFAQQVEARIRLAIETAIFEVTGERVPTNKYTVRTQKLDHQDAGYFFKRYDPHTGDRVSLGWGDLLEIAAGERRYIQGPLMSHSELIESVATERFLEAREFMKGRHAYSLGSEIEFGTASMAALLRGAGLINSDRTSMKDVSSRIRMRPESVTYYSKRVLQDTNLDDLPEEPAELSVLRLPLATMEVQHGRRRARRFADLVLAARAPDRPQFSESPMSGCHVGCDHQDARLTWDPSMGDPWALSRIGPEQVGSPWQDGWTPSELSPAERDLVDDLGDMLDLYVDAVIRESGVNRVGLTKLVRLFQIMLTRVDSKRAP